MSNNTTATYNNGSISASLSGLAAGTTYFYKPYLTIQGTGDYSSEVQTFEGSVRSFTTTESETPTPENVPTWLSSYEIPAYSINTVSTTDIEYANKYCHRTVSETFGTTKACVYNTTNTNQTIVVHTYEYNSTVSSTYSMLFDKDKRCALWVAYVFDTTEHVDKNVGRNNGWGYDPAIPQDWQPNLTNTYSALSGQSFSRGHQCASNDRQTTVNENKQTFYYSNMTPQNQTLNGGTWAVLEADCQSKGSSLTSYQKLYVVTGPIFESGYRTTKDSSNHDCAIPTKYYKCVMLCTFNTSGQMIDAKGTGFTFVHNGTNAPRVVTTIDAVEALTGIDFFANIPDALENAAESYASPF